MATTALIFLILFFLLGFFSLFFSLPGTWIILGSSVLYGWVTQFENVTLSLLLLLFLLAVIAEILEYSLGISGAERYGASKRGATISILGGIVGAILFAPILFGLGSLIGLFIGAFVSAFLYELITQRSLSKSLKSGFGALLGRVSGTMVKLFLALGMIVAVLWQIF